MVRMKRKTQTSEELKATSDANKIRKKRKDVESRFKYLKNVDDSMFQYSFLRAQAEEICDILDTIKYGPFKAFYHNYKAMVYEASFMEDYYLQVNEHGELEPNHERLSKHLPIKIILQE